MLMATVPAQAQTGGLLLGRVVDVAGRRSASTGNGAIDVGGTASELAVLAEGRKDGFEWRLRGQSTGRVDDFPDDASLSIKALSYGRRLTGSVFAAVGKQQRVWGAGVAYQPLGFLRTQVNLRDPTDAEGRGEGVPMVYVSRLADPVTLEAVAADDLRRGGGRQWAVRASGQVGGLELSGLVRQRTGAAIGVGGSSTWAGRRIGLYGDAWLGPPERRRLVEDRALDAELDERRLIGAQSRARRLSYALGLNYTPVDRLTLTTELDRRGEGLGPDRWRRLVAALRAATGDVRSARAAAAYRDLAAGIALLSGTGVRRDYLFQRISYAGERFGMSANVTVGLADGGVSATGVASVPVMPRLSIALAATRTFGSDTSEFGLAPVESVLSLSIRRGFDL